MATITFDVYMPAGHTRALRSAFLQTARDLPGVADSRVSVNILPDPALPQEVVDQLAATYRPVGEDAGEVGVTRFVISAPDLTSSVNQLAMRLSRLLTPAVNLPADRVLLDNELDFEVPAIFPWMVQVER
ncbi:hypothetical protein [uncultured Corynebacterium sp.]|uniref:hypothetical protein n=1 Tax=uncultured Corynebacterium sp. TaxID=159447 RepID=UPI0026190B8F|nr:hypothetical protein [uncultured Corynebacterium sp.]